MLNRLKRVLFTAIFIMSGPVLAESAKDTALVTTLNGEASYSAPHGKPATIQSFMKLREGDKAEVKAGAKLQMVYLENGEVELWSGPAAFTVGTLKTDSIQLGTPVTRKLPAAMLDRIARTTEVMSDIRNRTGMVVVRGIGGNSEEMKAIKAELVAVKEVYEDLRKNLPEDDITPELALFNALYRAKSYNSALAVLETMRQKAPNDPQVAALAEEFKSKLH